MRLRNQGLPMQKIRKIIQWYGPKWFYIVSHCDRKEILQRLVNAAIREGRSIEWKRRDAPVR
jgi:hypothetical protein